MTISYYHLSRRQDILLSFVLFFLMFLIGIAHSQSVQRPPITGIDHIAFKCNDLNAARAFYGQQLGLHETEISVAEPQKTAYLRFDVNARQHLRLSRSLTGTEDRLEYVSFMTTDLARMREYFLVHGVRVGELQQDQEGRLFFRLADPDGHVLEFTQSVQNKLPESAFAQNISRRIMHLGLYVQDAQKSDRFYRDLLGFVEFWRGGNTDSVTNWINMRIPESTDYIEYMLAETEPSETRLCSMHHVCLLVPDLQEALNQLAVRLQNDFSLQPRVGRNNRWLLNLHDQNGTRVELMEPHTVR